MVLPLCAARVYNARERIHVLNVRVRLFAVMAQQAGVPAVTLALPEDARVRDVQRALQEQFGVLKWIPGTMLAVNQEYVGPEHPLQEADEVAVIPPVSGG
jgi:molybdopterin converting factor subunit 1